MEPDGPASVWNILDLRIYLFFFSPTKGVSHMVGSLLGFVRGSAASLLSDCPGAQALAHTHSRRAASTHVVGRGGSQDTERAVLLGRSHFPPRSLAPVRNEFHGE